MNERPRQQAWRIPFVMVPTFRRFICIGKPMEPRKGTDTILPRLDIQEVQPPRRKKAEALAKIPLNYIRWSNEDTYPTERPVDQRQTQQFFEMLLMMNRQCRLASFDFSRLVDCLAQLDKISKLFNGKDMDYSLLINQRLRKLGYDLSHECFERVSKSIYKFWRLRQAGFNQIIHSGDNVQPFFARAKSLDLMGLGRATRNSIQAQLVKQLKTFRAFQVESQLSVEQPQNEISRLSGNFKRFNQQLRKSGYKYILNLKWMHDEEKEQSKNQRKRPRSKTASKRKGSRTLTDWASRGTESEEE